MPTMSTLLSLSIPAFEFLGFRASRGSRFTMVLAIEPKGEVKDEDVRVKLPKSDVNVGQE